MTLRILRVMTNAPSEDADVVSAHLSLYAVPSLARSGGAVLAVAKRAGATQSVRIVLCEAARSRALTRRSGAPRRRVRRIGHGVGHGGWGWLWSGWCVSVWGFVG